MNDSNSLSKADKTALKARISGILEKAKQLGATAAELSGSIDCGLSTTVRMGEVETVEFNQDQGLGITVYFGQRKGNASSTDFREEALTAALQAACDIAKASGEDEFAGLADPKRLATDYPDLDLYHPWNVSPEEAIELAMRCETLAREQDKRITNSEGATVSTYQSYYVYANSNNFIGDYQTSRQSLSCVLVATEAADMQRDYAYTVARDVNDLASSEWVAKEAAKRTVERLNSRQVPTQSAPVIFHADVASGLLGSFLQAISGRSQYLKSSFLTDCLHQKVFPEFIRIDERPHLAKALGSAPFDSEGVCTNARDIVSDGVLQSYILSSYSARKLGMETTGNAGGVRNVFINTSDDDLPALLKRMGTGLLVTELMGQGLNMTTGDYSRGAAGFWVENGKIQYAVSEITIAGNMKDMLQHIVAIANDVDHRKNIKTGSIFIESMMIAGQ